MGEHLYPIRTRFNGGELSPSVFLGRIDLPQYGAGLERCENWIPMMQGPIRRRGGTVYVAPAKQTNPVRLIPFRFSPTQSYILEFGAGYIRFFRNRAQILSGSVPYEISTTYTQADLFKLSVAQSEDFMYIACPGKALRTLTRLADASWTIADTAFVEPPYAASNITDITMSSSGSTSTRIYNLTASSAYFVSGDVGKTISIGGTASVRCVYTITSITSTTVAVATLSTSPYSHQTTSTQAATVDWRKSVSPNAAAVGLYNGRLWLAGFDDNASRVSGSCSGDFSAFAPAEEDNNTLDTNAITVSLYGGQSSGSEQAMWMTPVKNGLAVGTASSEWIITGSSTSSVLTPDNAYPSCHGATGSAAGLPAFGRGYRVFHVSKDARQLIDFAYNVVVEGFEDITASALADHILISGVVSVAEQTTPNLVYWFVLNDGTMAAMTFSSKEEVKAWHRHSIGGSGVVTSVACIVNPLLTNDDVWVSVQRTIDGASVQYIEYMAETFTYNSDAFKACCLDSSVYYESSTPFSSVSGLTWLKGCTVRVLADAASQNDYLVDSSGVITLETTASKIVVGLPYSSIAVIPDQAVQVQNGTSVARRQRIVKVYAKLYRSFGLTCGRSMSELKAFVYRSTSDKLGEAVPLKTGEASVQVVSSSGTESSLYLVSDSAFPCELAALVFDLKVGD